MRHMTILVSTRNRLAKLRRMLATIPDCPMWSPMVLCDGDRETFDALYPEGVNVWLMEKHVGSVVCRNRATPHITDGILYTTDDVEFLPGGIQMAFGEFNKAFPDDDGVLGIRQQDAHHKTGIAVVGKRFLDRYPDRKLFWPGYYHFASQEVGAFAEAIGRLEISSRVLLKHHHPLAEPREMDQTHYDARAWRDYDLGQYETRRANGEIYGRSPAYA